MLTQDDGNGKSTHNTLSNKSFKNVHQRPEVLEHIDVDCQDMILGLAQPVFRISESGATIFLGPQAASCVRAYEDLKAKGVCAIVNCTLDSPNVFQRVENSAKRRSLSKTSFFFKDLRCIEYCCVPVRDREGVNISRYFQWSSEFIHRHISTGNSVLVHCNMGVSRSSTIVIAYLCWSLGLTRDDAYRQIKRVRSNINPNAHFWRQLADWEGM